MTALPVWPRCLDATLGAPRPAGFRLSPEDFRVDEQLDFKPEGQGEHLWLRIEKRNQSTLEAARQLARLCNVSPRAVGYSGMKDRVAVTRQWLSVQLPGRNAPDDLAAQLATLGITVLEQARHPRKLKRGVHRTNRFILRLQGEAVEQDDFQARWERLCREGVPNYFGPQRFGTHGQNLQRAEALLARGWRKRDDRQGMLLSCARSFLFNELLGQRVARGDWQSLLEGETVMLEGTHSLFRVDQLDTTLVERAAKRDIHPTGLLWGADFDADDSAAQQLEAALAEQHPVLTNGLAQSGVKSARRALRVCLDTPVLESGQRNDEAVISFSLPRGAFATAVLSELISQPDVTNTDTLADLNKI